MGGKLNMSEVMRTVIRRLPLIALIGLIGFVVPAILAHRAPADYRFGMLDLVLFAIAAVLLGVCVALLIPSKARPVPDALAEFLADDLRPTRPTPARQSGQSRPSGQSGTSGAVRTGRWENGRWTEDGAPGSGKAGSGKAGSGKAGRTGRHLALR